jgi:hypothetical protein
MPRKNTRMADAITPLEEWQAGDTALADLDDYDFVVWFAYAGETYRFPLRALAFTYRRDAAALILGTGVPRADVSNVRIAPWREGAASEPGKLTPRQPYVRKGLTRMTHPAHWHGQAHPEADLNTFDDRFAALGWAADELDRFAEGAHESVSLHGDAGAYEDAYRAFQRAERYAGLAANARTAHTQGTLPREQRAPHYQDPDESVNAARLALYAEHITDKILAGDGPAGFRLWQCPDDTCVLTEPA